MLPGSPMTTRLHLPVVRTQWESGVVPPSSSGPSGPSEADPLLDGFARRIRYLRVSVTDRCNYRCTYCMPEALEDRMHFQPRAALLVRRLEQIVDVFARLGVRKIA